MAGILISALRPGAKTDAALTGLSGMCAAFMPSSTIVMPPIAIAAGAGAEHSLSSQETASLRTVARWRDISRSGFPLSTQAWMRCDEPSDNRMSASTTTRLWSMVAGTVTASGWGAAGFFSALTVAWSKSSAQAAMGNRIFILEL